MYISPYGKYEGLAARLRETADRLSKQQGFPWVGLGLIDDLHAAGDKIEGIPERKKYTERLQDDEPAATTVEYDL